MQAVGGWVLVVGGWRLCTLQARDGTIYVVWVCMDRELHHLHDMAFFGSDNITRQQQ